jgi:hypothetical protein
VKVVEPQFEVFHIAKAVAALPVNEYPALMEHWKNEANGLIVD